MVVLTGKWSFLEASCCRVEVVKGGAGVRTPSFFSMVSIVNVAPMLSSRNLRASSMSLNLVSRVAFTFTLAGAPAGWKTAEVL